MYITLIFIILSIFKSSLSAFILLCNSLINFHLLLHQPSKSSLASNFAPIKERNRNLISVDLRATCIKEKWENGGGILCHFCRAFGFIVDEKQRQTKFSGQRAYLLYLFRPRCRLFLAQDITAQGIVQ